MKKVELRKVAGTLSIWAVVLTVHGKITVAEQYPNFANAKNRAEYFKRMDPRCTMKIIY